MKFLLFVVCIAQLFDRVWMVHQQIKQTLQKSKDNIGENQRLNDTQIPNCFLRIYDDWVKSSIYDGRIIKSIPLSVHQRNKFRLDLEVSLPETNERRIERVDILMEFYDVPKPRKAENETFHAQIVPRDSRISGKTQKESGKSVQKSLVEMSFDVTDLLRSHLELRKKNFKVKMHIKRDGEKKTKASLGGKARGFLVFYESIEDTSSVVYADDSGEGSTTGDVLKVPKSSSRNATKKGKKHQPGTEYVRGNNNFYPAWNHRPISRRYGTCGFQYWKVSSRNLPWSFEAVHPPEIEVNRCQGGCNKRRKYPSNRQELGPYMRALQLSRAPCCVPLVLKPQLMIVRFKGFFEFVMIEGLRMAECGCM